MAYVSQQTSRFEVYVTAFPGGGTRYQVSGSGGIQPTWSPDGKTLYFVTLDRELMAVDVDGRGTRFEIKVPRSLFRVNLFVGPRIASAYAVTADGNACWSTAPAKAEPRVALVTNWLSGLTQ